MAADRACREEPFDIIHAYDYPWLQGAAAVWAAQRVGARSVLSTFGEVIPHRNELAQHDDFGWSFRALSRWALQTADATASMTEHCRDQVRHVGVDPDANATALVRMVVGMGPFENAIDRLGLRARYGARGPVLLFVGQIRPRKGPQVLIEAFRLILTEWPDAQLWLIGPDHGFASDLHSLVKRLELAPSIKFVGAISDQDLPSYYAACDLFCFPTITPIECLGLTFVQAMFAGRPVIATRIAGAPEVINDGVSGLLVPPGDPAALAARAVEFLRLPSDRQAEIGREGRERVNAMFDERSVLEDLTSLYDSVLGSGAPA